MLCINAISTNLAVGKIFFKSLLEFYRSYIDDFSSSIHFFFLSRNLAKLLCFPCEKFPPKQSKMQDKCFRSAILSVEVKLRSSNYIACFCMRAVCMEVLLKAEFHSKTTFHTLCYRFFYMQISLTQPLHRCPQSPIGLICFKVTLPCTVKAAQGRKMNQNNFLPGTPISVHEPKNNVHKIKRLPLVYSHEYK